MEARGKDLQPPCVRRTKKGRRTAKPACQPIQEEAGDERVADFREVATRGKSGEVVTEGKMGINRKRVGEDALVVQARPCP